MNESCVCVCACVCVLVCVRAYVCSCVRERGREGGSVREREFVYDGMSASNIAHLFLFPQSSDTFFRFPPLFLSLCLSSFLSVSFHLSLISSASLPPLFLPPSLHLSVAPSVLCTVHELYN